VKQDRQGIQEPLSRIMATVVAAAMIIPTGMAAEKEEVLMAAEKEEVLMAAEKEEAVAMLSAESIISCM
jgi:hypothetical protein